VSDWGVYKFREQSLPCEKEVMDAWIGSEPIVSILCMSYNHDRYIEDAIRGFLFQKTNFPFEIIIHDDASTDGTRSIVEKYAIDYPKIIRPVFQDENQYSKGVKILLHTASYAIGEYIAFCEGDDFWISDDKLQTQVDALKEVPDCEICFHSAVKVTNDIPDKHLFCRRASGNCLISVEPIIRCGGSFMPTASMLIRRSFFDRAFQDNSSFYKKYLMGYFCQIFCSLAGGALYIDRPMSVYRSFSEGSWTQTLSQNQGFYEKWLTTYLASLREADARTGYKYSADFLVPVKRCHLGVLNNKKLDVSFRRKYFVEHRKEIGLIGVVLWFSIFRIPLIHHVFLKLRSFKRNYFGQG
jgi:glycosyltransferase involved in cell wall biosynthesis